MLAECFLEWMLWGLQRIYTPPWRASRLLMNTSDREGGAQLLVSENLLWSSKELRKRFKGVIFGIQSSQENLTVKNSNFVAKRIISESDVQDDVHFLQLYWTEQYRPIYHPARPNLWAINVLWWRCGSYWSYWWLHYLNNLYRFVNDKGWDRGRRREDAVESGREAPQKKNKKS